MPVTDEREAGDSENESTLTVVMALGANALVAIAKTVAAMLTASASMVAEAAHSWADTGNEALLMIANRRSRRAPDARHPLGFGREAYVWSMFAALGLFAVGAGVSITHGIGELVHPTPVQDYLVGYIVLAVSFVLEGLSFRQAYRQTRREARAAHRDVLSQAMATSDPTVRAVFAEDAAALIGIVIAAAGIAVHQATGWAPADAIGSILVGLLLGAVALVLVNRNRQYLIGEEVDPRVRSAALASLLALPQIDRVTYLRMEFLGPRQVLLTATVDLTGDEAEHTIAQTLSSLRAGIKRQHPAVREAIVTLATADEESLTLP